MPKTLMYQMTALSLGLLLVLGAGCSEVRLNYGLGGSGLTSLSDRNLNANTPGSFENLTGTTLPTPSPTGHPGSGGNNSNTSAGGAGTVDNQASEALIESQPSTDPDELRGHGDAPSAKDTLSNSGNFRLRLAPGGVIYLNGVGDSRFVTILLEDLRGNSLNPNDFELVWDFVNTNIAQKNGNSVISRVPSGETLLKISLKEDPNTWIQVPVIVRNEPPAGGGGGGGGTTPTPTPAPPVPSIPGTSSTPFSVSSFTIHLTPPDSTPVSLQHYEITISGAPGETSFTVPIGTSSFEVPASAQLVQSSTYPYSVRVRDVNNQLSPVINAFGTTLPSSEAPLNLIGGSQNFTAVIPVPVNGSTELNSQNGNALHVGDATNPETLTVTLQPTAANFGTVSVPVTAAGVNVTGSGTFADPLVITGPKDAVNDTLARLVYTAQNGFIGNASVRITSADAQAGTPDDIDILVFNVSNGPEAIPDNVTGIVIFE